MTKASFDVLVRLVSTQQTWTKVDLNRKLDAKVDTAAMTAHQVEAALALSLFHSALSLPLASLLSFNLLSESSDLFSS